MGFYVGVNLSFSANNSEGSLKALSDAAKKTLNEVPDDYDGKHVRIMCEQIILDPNRYVHGGNKGDMFVWSGVWNYYNFDNEKDALVRFLLNCWEPTFKKEKDEILFFFDRALLLVNREQSETTQIYGFRLKEGSSNQDFVDDYLPEIIIETDESHLSWNQY